MSILASAFRAGEVQWLEVSEFPAPNGTVTIVIDHTEGIMDIFTEHEPHPEDWAVACGFIRKLCDTEDIGEPGYLKGVDTFRVRLRP